MDQELAYLLRDGRVDEFNQKRPTGKIGFFGLDLSKRNLTGINLSDATIEKCNLDEADFVEATLDRASFITCSAKGSVWTKAKARSIQLVGVDLEKACLDEMQAEQAKLIECNMRAANITDLNLDHGFLKNIYGWSILATGARFTGAKIFDSNFSWGYFGGADFSYALISDSVLMGTNCYGAKIQNLHVSKSCFMASKFVHLVGEKAIFRDSDLSFVTFDELASSARIHIKDCLTDHSIILP